MKPSWTFFTSCLPISQLFTFSLHSWPLRSYVYPHLPGGQWRSSGSGTTRTKDRIFLFLPEMLRGTLWRLEGVLKRFMKFLAGIHRLESPLGLPKRPRWVFLQATRSRDTYTCCFASAIYYQDWTFLALLPRGNFPIVQGKDNGCP